MHHPLDRPVWASLVGPQASLSEGGPLARRYQADIHLFAATPDDSPAAQRALADLVGPGEQVFVVQADPIAIPPGLQALKQARLVQMVATRTLSAADAGPDCEPLGEADAAEILALARLTEPGPFLPRTHTMGRFLGIRDGGRLVAMAGERFRPPGHTEVSGVCAHPDWRGRGLARRLSTAVTAAIQARGDTPFLHAWVTNRPAIELYERLGFVLRRELNGALLTRPAAEPAPPSTP